MTTQNMQVTAPAGTPGRLQVKVTSGSGYVGFDLPGAVESAQAARRLLRRFLGESATPELLICASELVSNAILHSRSALPGGRFVLAVQVEGGGVVLVSVLDEGARTHQDPPAARLPEVEHGRGLMIVAGLSVESGSTEAFGGQLSWFRIKVCDPAAGRDALAVPRDAAETLRRDASETPAGAAVLAGSRS